MSRVLLFGATGQVGTALLRSAPAHATIIAPASAEVDLQYETVVRSFVRDTRADVIINCAAFTKVDDAETNVDGAFALNANAPRAMAEEAKRYGARVLHISTDYVFDGNGPSPYSEHSAVSPLSVYGKSKLAGEQAVLAAATSNAVVRTAWVHSGGGVNFVVTATKLLRKGGVMRTVDDQVGTPTRAANLANALWTLVTKAEVTGLLQFTDAGVASWYDVAECVLETLISANAAGEGARVVPVDSSAFPRPAKRPRVAIMDKHATWAALGATPPHWRAGVIASTHEIIHA